MTIKVMLSGLPGKVSSEVLRTLLLESHPKFGERCRNVYRLPHIFRTEQEQAESISITPYGLKGTRYKNDNYLGVKLYSPELHKEGLSQVLDKYTDLLVVDFTTPQVANQNVELYARLGVPFVMGTTGGDREKLYRTVRESDISAVISPNMSPPLVVLSAALDYLSREFPNALQGYEGHISESHQSAKKDVSGTAKNWKDLLEILGPKFDEIESIRDSDEQHVLGIPEEHLVGHAYHWIDISGSDVKLGISTAVNGRKTYVEGTLVALRYLHRKIQEGSKGEIFSMIDVLKGV